EPLDVISNCCLVYGKLRREEEVDAERTLCPRPHVLDLLLELDGRLVAGGEEAEAASLGYRCRELRRRRPSGERRANHRHVHQRPESVSAHEAAAPIALRAEGLGRSQKLFVGSGTRSDHPRGSAPLPPSRSSSRPISSLVEG